MNKSCVRLVPMPDIPNYFRGLDVIVVVDENVYGHYEDFVMKVAKNNKDSIWIVRGGENAKNFNAYEKCCEYFLAFGVHRRSHLVAIGGGAVSDLAGFVAATLLRGISWSVVPTTLLSMIDASIGGKTGVNTEYGKNLVGSFHMPLGVYLDISFLDTLPRQEYQSGLGELVKYTFLSKDIFNQVASNVAIHEIVQACAVYKEGVVEEDFKEAGKRKILNFGHTLGHALEKHYTIPHGESVFWGCFLVLKLYSPHFIVDFLSTAQKLKMEHLTPPWVEDEINVDSLIAYVRRDKKKIDAEKIELIVIEQVGCPKIFETDISTLATMLKEKKDEIQSFRLSS